MEYFTKMCQVIHLLFIIQSIFVMQAHGIFFNCSQPPNLTNFDVNSCCRIPEINLGNLPEKCDKYINSIRSDKNENFPTYAHVCYPDCIYRETGSMVNGEIKLLNVQKFLMNNVNKRDKDFVPHISRSFEICLSNINGYMEAAGLKMYASLPEGCSPYASMIFGCVNAETFLHCPPKMWKNERNCNLAKEFAEQCNPLPHVPLPVF